MGRKAARRRAVAEWFLEVSALVFVFPALDLVMTFLGGSGSMRWGLVLLFGAITLIFLGAGVFLIREEA